MTFKEKYKAAFSQVCTPKAIELEDFKMKQSIKRNGRRVVIIAAVVCLLAALSVSALATNLFGLRNMVLPNKTEMDIDHAQNVWSNEDTENSGTSEPVAPFPAPELISLQGYSNSKEYQAVAEWKAFLDSYDKDGELLAAVGNGPTGLDEKYSLYLVYTQEMADKLDEITAKYGLMLHRTLEVDLSAGQLYEKAGTGKFLGPNNISLSAYIYDDGTFHIDGEAFVNEKMISYQMMNCKKGSFTDVLLNIGSYKDYTEWTYKTASGVTVSLSISPTKALVVADFESSFVTINVLAGSADGFSGPLTTFDLEAFADSFDFSVFN